TAGTGGTAGTGAGGAGLTCGSSGDCDPYADSCGAGKVCLPRPSDGRTTCMTEAAVPKQEHEVCVRQECAPGLACLSSFPEYDWHCQRLCPPGSHGRCGPGEVCGDAIGYGCIMNCVPVLQTCDIYAQDCANPEEACAPTMNVETGQKYTGCHLAPVIAEGKPCEVSSYLPTCARGQICAFPSGLTESSCQRVCRPGGTPTCPTGQACTGLFGGGW